MDVLSAMISQIDDDVWAIVATKEAISVVNGR